jgi:hypothetical protein
MPASFMVAEVDGAHPQNPDEAPPLEKAGRAIRVRQIEVLP